MRPLGQRLTARERDALAKILVDEFPTGGEPRRAQLRSIEPDSEAIGDIDYEATPNTFIRHVIGRLSEEVDSEGTSVLARVLDNYKENIIGNPKNRWFLDRCCAVLKGSEDFRRIYVSHGANSADDANRLAEEVRSRLAERFAWAPGQEVSVRTSAELGYPNWKEARCVAAATVVYEATGSLPDERFDLESQMLQKQVEWEEEFGGGFDATQYPLAVVSPPGVGTGSIFGGSQRIALDGQVGWRLSSWLSRRLSTRWGFAQKEAALGEPIHLVLAYPQADDDRLREHLAGPLDEAFERSAPRDIREPIPIGSRAPSGLGDTMREADACVIFYWTTKDPWMENVMKLLNTKFLEQRALSGRKKSDAPFHALIVPVNPPPDDLPVKPGKLLYRHPDLKARVYSLAAQTLATAAGARDASDRIVEFANLVRQGRAE